MHGPDQRRRVAALVLLGCLLLAGCGAASTPGPGTPTPVPTPAAVSPVVEDDGLLLRSLGVANGPVDSLSLPRTTVFAVIVDQPTSVSLVITQPGAAEVYAYLQRSLPGAGFTVTAESSATQTLTFAGRGWSGSFTGDARAGAVLLRPA